jgi:hypothetical protein
MTRKMTAAAAALLLLTAGSVGTASAQSTPASATVSAASGWAAWHGCWRPAGEEVPTVALVCIAPGETPSTIRVIAFDGVAIVEESAVHADGQPRPVNEGGCTGTETAAWSQDGRRVFTRAELDCAGVRRVSTGVIALIAENEWIDAQAVTVADQHATRAVRYRSVRPENVPAALAHLVPERQLALEAARIATSRPLDVDAVVEASGRVAEPALEALLAARQHGFGLNARTLLDLEQRGVAASVIDMMIALSYPRTFAVQEQPRTESMDRGQWTSASRRALGERCRDAWYRDRNRMECDSFYASGYSPYGYSPYGFNRYGYSPYGYDNYGWHYGRGPIVVIVRPEDSARGGDVVPGRGYTRGNAEPSGRTARPRDGGSAQPNSAGSSSGANATQPSTNSGTSTGRQAVPRPNNDGGGNGNGGNNGGSGGNNDG